LFRAAPRLHNFVQNEANKVYKAKKTSKPKQKRRPTNNKKKINKAKIRTVKGFT